MIANNIAEVCGAPPGAGTTLGPPKPARVASEAAERGRWGWSWMQVEKCWCHSPPSPPTPHLQQPCHQQPQRHHNQRHPCQTISTVTVPVPNAISAVTTLTSPGHRRVSSISVATSAAQDHPVTATTMQHRHCQLTFTSQCLFCHHIVITQHHPSLPAASTPSEAQAPGGTRAATLSLVFNFGVTLQFLMGWEKVKNLEWDLISKGRVGSRPL